MKSSCIYVTLAESIAMTPQISIVEEPPTEEVSEEDIELAVKASVEELGLTAGEAFNSTVVQLACLNNAHRSVCQHYQDCYGYQ